MKRYNFYLVIGLLWLLSAGIALYRQHTSFAAVAAAIAALNLVVFARGRRQQRTE